MKTIIVVLALSLIYFFTLNPAFAADSSENHWEVYAKSGWFVWNEKTDTGAQYMRDEGMLYALGVTRKDTVYRGLSFRETLEVWGGAPKYDGTRILTGEPVSKTNSYIGTREEIRAEVAVPVTSSVTLTHFVGLAHKAWYRELEGETWQTVTSPMGARIEVRASKNASFFLEGAAVIPISSRNRWSLENLGDGYEDTTLKPKARVGQSMEIGVNVHSCSISISHEATVFDRSDTVTSKSLDGERDGGFYQPYSKTSTTWLRIGYSF